MILYPLNSVAAGGSARSMSVWDAISQKQKQEASEWWLVTQPDHASLAGDLAARVCSADFPSLDEDVIQAITLHDAGWARFEGKGAVGIGTRSTFAPHLDDKGRPLSFLDVMVADFLVAWVASIDRAEQVAPIGGIIVSEHFSRLGEMRLSMNVDVPENSEKLGNFVRCETWRRERLARQDTYSETERGVLVDVLQFCDLLSLYLCCGSKDNVEFPQRFRGRPVRLWRETEECRLEPSLFGAGTSLGVTARRYPTDSVAFTIPFLLG